MSERITNLQSSPIPELNAASNRFTQSFRRPGEYLCPDGVIFDDLEKTIRRHLFAHVLPSTRKSAERALVIQGAPGVGKTVASCDAALRYGFGVALLSASMLASEHEGGATETLDQFLDEVVAFSKSNRLRMVAVFDDFDLGIARNNPKTGDTINSYLLTQRFQFLGSTRLPTNFDDTGLPFLFTGNDFTDMRSSLFRDERATWYTHAPTADEKLQIAHFLLRPRTPEERKLVDRLARTYVREPIAFWASLRNDLTRARLDAVIDLELPSIEAAEAELKKRHYLDAALVQRLAKDRLSNRPRSFL